jgi:hypothetical protein
LSILVVNATAKGLLRFDALNVTDWVRLMRKRKTKKLMKKMTITMTKDEEEDDA